MALLLCIETSSVNCSVALVEDGELVELIESSESYSHAEKLHPFIVEILKKSGKQKSQLQGIVLGSGPGSFTGLRIGSGAAKGLCYALSIPLMTMTSLENMSLAIQELKKEISLPESYFLCPLIDARRMEVYTCLYDQDMKLIQEPEAKILDESSFLEILDKKAVVFFGDGMDKMKEMVVSNKNALFVADQLPSAKNCRIKAEHLFTESKFEDIAYFEPFYLKGFVPTTPKKLL